MKYILVCANYNFELCRQVNETIKDGWKLYGSPFSNGSLFCQALVKEESDDDAEIHS